MWARLVVDESDTAQERPSCQSGLPAIDMTHRK